MCKEHIATGSQSIDAYSRFILGAVYLIHQPSVYKWAVCPDMLHIGKVDSLGDHTQAIRSLEIHCIQA